MQMLTQLPEKTGVAVGNAPESSGGGLLSLLECPFLAHPGPGGKRPTTSTDRQHFTTTMPRSTARPWPALPAHLPKCKKGLRLYLTRYVLRESAGIARTCEKDRRTFPFRLRAAGSRPWPPTAFDFSTDRGTGSGFFG